MGFSGEMEVVGVGENLGVEKMAAMGNRERERERERDCQLLSPEGESGGLGHWVWGMGVYQMNIKVRAPILLRI